MTRIYLIRCLTSKSITSGHISNRPPNMYVVFSPIDQYAIYIERVNQELQRKTTSKRILPNDASKGPMARASACKLLNIPKIVPFSLSKPYFDPKLLITLITILEAK